MKDIPQIWFVHQREYLETYYEDLSGLYNALPVFASRPKWVEIRKASDSLRQLSASIGGIQQVFDDDLAAPRSNAPYLCTRNELGRIKELAGSTAGLLESIAKQVCWGKLPNQEIARVRRNVPPLLKLVQGILAWLDTKAQ